MFEPRPTCPWRRRALALAFLAGTFMFLGCASDPDRGVNLTPILPAAQSRLETASPAARDALSEGLRWIAADAAETRVEKLPPKDSAKGTEP